MMKETIPRPRLLFNFIMLVFRKHLTDYSELQVYLEKLQVGVLEATARDEGSRWGVFSAARARGDTIRTFCGSSVKLYFLMIFDFSRSDFSSDLVVDLSLPADLEKYFPASTIGTGE